MSLTINNNISSLIAEQNLNNSSNMLSASLQRLSSGLKINSAADGPAALVIAEEHQAQISGLTTAIDNTSKAVDVAQTAEGALGEENTLLLQIRSLAVDSANAGVNDGTSLAANQAEIANALDTINRIATSTRFGSKVLLDGSQSASSASVVGGTGTNSPITSVTANGTAVGTYSAVITTAATQATATGSVTGLTHSGNVLGANETENLTINGVQIGLQGGTNGLTTDNAIAQINTYSNQTGVTASLNSSGALVLTANTYGSGNKISVTSTGALNANGTSATDGTGLLNATIADGTDVVGNLQNSAGNTITSTGHGLTLVGANGLTVNFSANATPGTANVTSTATGTVGSLTPNSLVLKASGDAETLGFTVNGSAQTITLTAGAGGMTAQGAINYINTQNKGVTASLQGGSIVLTSNTLGSAGTLSAFSETLNAAATADTSSGLGMAAPTIVAGVSAVNAQTIQVANNSMVFQIGANAGDTTSLSITRAAADSLGQGVSDRFTSLNQISVINPSNTTDVLAVVDKAIADVSSLRGTLGAFQTNTLEATANNLQTMLTNTTAAESTIMDTNFASETANYTKDQVLVQAGTQVLKNSNATSQLILGLLQ